EVRKEENVKTYRFEKTQESWMMRCMWKLKLMGKKNRVLSLMIVLLIKAANLKVVTTAATTTTTKRPKDKGVVVQELIPLKRKDQIALDEQIARDIQAKLDAELLEEQKLARKQEEEANIALIESWENTQAMMEADRLLAERLQSKEREELTDEEKAKLFMELMEKRRKHFAALRAQEKRNRPPTKAQKRTQMSTYLKHMGGYTYKQLKGKSFDEIQKLFDKEMKRVNTFVAMGSEVQESKEKKEECREETTKGRRKKMLGRKRAGKEQQKESSKKQKVEEEKKSEEVDEAELKKLLAIKKDEDIAIDDIPLATKLLVIIDYKLHKEGMSSDKKIVLPKPRLPTPFTPKMPSPPSPIAQTQNRFIHLTPYPPTTSPITRPTYSALAHMQGISQDLNRLPTPISPINIPRSPSINPEFQVNPNKQVIKILEPIEEQKLNQSFNTNFYTNDYQTREYYEAVLVDSKSIQVRHNYNREDPTKIDFSKVKIFKVLSPEDWNNRPCKVTTVSIKISTAGTYYCLCSVSAAGYKDTTVADLQLLEDLLLSRG
ncbi:hypothetical protein Tco_0485015, partial [Tanacetum coccineum]